ncbi:MAG TPA: antitoxin [Myxococcales bacterium]|nr:antitoxin [Myxococcales bacterium]
MSTDRIEINPAVLSGKPVIRGTRIPVELVLRKLAEGASEAELIDAYPRLTREDIQAALSYAADSVAHEIIVLAGK